MQLILGILLLVMAIFLVVAILFQQGKSHNLSGAIAGGADTFFGKAKSRTISGVLEKITAVVAVIFAVLVVVVYVSTVDKAEAPVENNTKTIEEADVNAPVEGDNTETDADADSENVETESENNVTDVTDETEAVDDNSEVTDETPAVDTTPETPAE